MECRFDYNSKFVSVNTCCDEKQVASLDVNLGMASGFIKRCPSCLQNFVRHFCEMTCASNQSDFLVVKGINQDKSKLYLLSTTKLLIFPLFLETNSSYITEVDLHITTNYMEGTYNSCRQVYVPALGQLALDIMCGQWGASRCSYSK
jgi:Niemann-Pick C1 protein